MNNAITYINPSVNIGQNSGFYVTGIQELVPIGYDEYRLFGSHANRSIPRRTMARILSHVSRKNVYPQCKFIPVTINHK